MNRDDESIFFNAPAIGLIVGDLAGGKDKKNGGSGLISPYGIDLAIMLGWTFGIFKSFGFTFAVLFSFFY